MVWFGGGRLETQVMLCAGRLLYFLIGLIGSKQDAKEIFERVHTYLRNKLKLNISPEKSGIHLAREGIIYLGYGIEVRYSERRIRMALNSLGGKRHILKRTLNAKIDLSIPKSKIIGFCHRHRYGNLVNGTARSIPALIYRSDAEIISYYNAQFRGFANFYGLARNASASLYKLQWIWRTSLLRTLARKHRSTVAQMARRLRHGRDYGVWINKGAKRRFVKVYSLRGLLKPNMAAKADVKPNVALYLYGRTEMTDRLQKNQCEYCGRQDGYMEAHHVRKLKDVKNEPGWKRVMIAMRRKVIILCTECHHALH